jgi:phage tail-like protein
MLNEESKQNFLFLNRDGRWPDFRWRGLELREDGALQLNSLPLLEGDLPKELAAAGAPAGPAGIAVDVDKTIYFSDPSGSRILRIDACDGGTAPIPCIGGEGGRPAQLNAPRGILIPRHRRSLFIADSANHRIQIFDLNSFQLVDIWGQADASKAPQPGNRAGLFNTPRTMAADDSGNIYVVDYGNRRVQKFDITGRIISSFWENIKRASVLTSPSDIAAGTMSGKVQVFIVDEALHAILVFDADGNPALDSNGQPVSFGSNQLDKPMGIAVTREAVYVGDNSRRRVLAFKRTADFPFIGEAVGYRGTVAALALNNDGDLLVHTGLNIAPVRLAIKSGYGMKGVLWSKAIKVGGSKVSWHRLQAQPEQIAAGAYLRLFVHTSNSRADAPTVKPESDNPFEDSRWRSRPVSPDIYSNVPDLFIGGDEARYVWVGALLSGDGRATPTLSQMRVEFDHESYLAHLPPIYLENEQCGDFLLRFLSLFESFFGSVEEEITDLAILFDPFATPKQFLPWLASWLALELDENWDEERQRQTIAEAFRLYGLRGTVEGLRRALLTFAGVNAIIEEPIINAAWWALPSVAGSPCKCGGPESNCKCKQSRAASEEKEWTSTENSILGVTTMLAPAHAQGAVVGSTATLDQSHLITVDDFGAPLFLDVANQFCVQVYQGQLKCADTLPQVRAIIEREKPAHTTYHLCILEPRMRVGFQARVGIDTVIAGPPSTISLGEGLTLGAGALGGEPTGQVGSWSQVGLTTRVG